jgi:hypothetical protein
MNASIVSGRVIAPPHFGHFAFMNSGESASGDLPFGTKFEMFVGRTTGRSLSGTGCGPHFVQWMIGIGQPQ